MFRMEADLIEEKNRRHRYVQKRDKLVYFASLPPPTLN